MGESKSKAEAMRMRKRLELDIGELDSALEHANLANMDLQKNIKNYQDRTKEKMMGYEDEQRAKDIARDVMLNAERRANTMQNALEEAKTMLDQADRARKMTEQEAIDANETLADLTVQNQSLATAKRKLETDLGDLRYEEDHAVLAERERKDLEQKVHDLQVQLDDAEQNAIKWGRKMAAKLENRIKDLEAELDGEQRRLGDATKNYKKAERGIRELSF